MRCRYVHAVKGSALALVAFGILSMLVPGTGESSEVELILTVSTFLFAILAGFYINRMNQRFDTIRELLGQEDAHWLTLYKGAAFFSPEFAEKLRELIDLYYITALDVPDHAYYKPTIGIFDDVHDEFAHATPKDANRNITTYMVELLAMLEERRNRISMLVREKLTSGQWLMVFILAGIVLYCLFYLKEPTISSGIITTMLSTVLVLVLLTMRDLQQFRLSGEFLGVESAEEMFDLLEKPRYYNTWHLDEGSVVLPSGIGAYRLGRHQPGSAGHDIIMKNGNGSVNP